MLPPAQDSASTMSHSETEQMFLSAPSALSFIAPRQVRPPLHQLWTVTPVLCLSPSTTRFGVDVPTHTCRTCSLRSGTFPPSSGGGGARPELKPGCPGAEDSDSRGAALVSLKARFALLVEHVEAPPARSVRAEWTWCVAEEQSDVWARFCLEGPFTSKLVPLSPVSEAVCLIPSPGSQNPPG